MKALSEQQLARPKLISQQAETLSNRERLLGEAGALARR
jgi:hypothetical protein